MTTTMTSKIPALTKRQSIIVSAVILLFSFLLLLPQILSKGVIAGSDFLFHYNRFYETAMQIKTGHYSYFLSIFGFYGSGRIVNAVYGPYFAYFQGLLVLISRNWFTYQLLSRFLLSTLAGFSLYQLLRKVSVSFKIALPLALFYMTTFYIHYWTFRQGFSSWGAAILPWCLIPAIDFVQTKKVKILPLAASVSAMTQIHMLSAFFLILVYIPFYLYGFVQAAEKRQVFLKGLGAAALSLLFSANIWGGLIEVGRNNNLVEPFINSKLYIMTINQSSIEWLLTPWPLVFFILYFLYFTLRHWRNYDRLTKLVTTTFFIFFVLSSSTFPWYAVNKLNLSIVNLIQFPFRFFIPATVLFILSLGLILERYFIGKWRKAVPLMLLLSVCIGLGQVRQLQQKKLTNFLTSDTPVKSQKRTFVWGNGDEVRASFFSSDLTDLLNLISKSTPDYFPSDKVNKENRYDLYEEFVLQYTDDFEKSQKDGTIILSWTADKLGTVTIPAAKYANSQLRLNGKVLSDKDYTLSAIRTPQVRQRAGKNSLEISYKAGSWFAYLLILNGVSWITVPCWLLVQAYRDRHN